ncbi:uncharacterized protein LOC143180568 [Calliopsis andreniformis]|uniref:uncharacterized protein LOC143180568 n=1 Tax=Calliopsis andreniformis TaxID=337506 RepID=UPI003FCE37C7
MTNSCRLIDTEYSRNFIKRKHKPVKIIIPRDYFAERIREGEIDPRVASIPTKLDEAAEQLIHKHILDYAQTVYQVTYKNPWAPQDERTAEDLGSELIAYIHGLYFDPHDEKVLAPPVTTKRCILAAVCFHLHWVRAKGTLQNWHNKVTLRNLNVVGFLSTVAGFTAVIWYLFCTFYYKIPITPIAGSTAISAVWSMICGKWGIFLMYHSHKYELIIQEGFAPILPESNA